MMANYHDEGLSEEWVPMLGEMHARTRELQNRLSGSGVDLALLTDQDSIAYYGLTWPVSRSHANPRLNLI